MPDAPAVDAPPAAPAAPVEPPAPVAGAPAPPAAPAAPEAPKPNALPEDVPALHAMIVDLRKENGADRTNAKTAAADAARTELAQTIGKALGLVPDETPTDPAELAKSVATSQADAKAARVELAVFRSAEAAGGDPIALLDSTSFLATLATVDPADTAAVTAAIQAAVAANSRLAATGGVRVPAPNPAQGAGPSGVPSIDDQITEAQKAGNFRLVIALQNQKLAAPK